MSRDATQARSVPVKYSVRGNAFLMLLALALVFSCFVSCLFGSESLAAIKVLNALSGQIGESERLAGVIVWDIRLPRAVLGALVGLVLAIGGAMMQGLFRNPLADPGLIGVSAGGSAGAVFFIVFGSVLLPKNSLLSELGRMVFPVMGGLAVTFFVYRIARFQGRIRVMTMLLCGLAVNACVAALIGLAVFAATTDQLRDYMFWALGSLSRASWNDALLLAPVGIAFMLSHRVFGRSLNLLQLGESEALNLGVNIETTRRQLIFLTATGVSLAVSLCGMIGFVGLITPHICRLLCGPDHRNLLPASGLLGGILLVNADTLSRLLVPHAELPVGIVTAAMGAPFFLFLIVRSQHRNES